MGFPGGSEGKASAYNVGDLGLIPGLGRSPGEGNGNPLLYSCLENSMDGGASVHGIAEWHTTEQLHFLVLDTVWKASVNITSLYVVICFCFSWVNSSKQNDWPV